MFVGSGHRPGGSWVLSLAADVGMFDEAFQLLGVITAVAAVLFITLPSRDDR